MPTIPTFETEGGQALGGAGPPRADASAFTAPGQALARGGEQVSDVANQFSAAYAGARRQADAAEAVSNGAKELNDLNFNLRKLPDSQAAFQQFGDGAKDIIARYRGAISDPLVQQHVVGALTQHATIQGELTRNQAFGVESSQRMSEQDNRFAQAARELADAGNPLLRAAIMDRIDGDAKSSAAAGWQSPDAASRKLSATYRSAALLKMADDPIAAKVLADEFTKAGRLTADDQAHLADRLENPVYRRIAENAAAATPIGGAAPPVDADTLTRAQAWRTGLIARGIDPDTATGIAARAVLESGANVAPAAGDGGISHGGLQWNKERLDNYIRLNGHRPEQGTLDEQLDFIKWELDGPEKPAADAIAAEPTLDGKARAVSLSYVRPGLTPEARAREAANTVSIARQLAGQPADDVASQLAAVREKTKDLPMQWQMHAESELLRRYHNTMAATAMQRGDLERGLANLEAAYTQGITSQDIPEDEIRRLVPGGRADQLIQNLTVARRAGDLFAGVQFASADQEQAARAALAIPGAIASNRIRVEGHQAVAPAAGVVPPGDETPEAVRLRTQLGTRYDQLLEQKHRALLTDGAAYAAAQPDVAAKLQAVDPQKPTTYADALNASLALQRTMGLPDQNARVLTNGQVAAFVRTLTTTIPAKGDMGQVLDQFSARFGDTDEGRALYARAFGELVQHGKLPAGFQIVGSMTEPGQVAARQDLIRALQQDSERGGAKRLSEIVPPDEKKTIDRDLDGYIADFRKTASVAGATGNLDLISNVRDAVRTLSYLYATQGKDGDTALKAAADGILNEKYDFSGTLRAPKGHAADAEAITAAVQKGITPASLAPVTGSPDLTPEQRTAIVAAAAQRKGIWVANERDDGAVLLAPLRDGSHVPVIRADGSRVEVKWPRPGQPWPSRGWLGDRGNFYGISGQEPPLQ